jgi:hypothetical protein
MSRFRFPLRRLAGGLLFSALLFGCDTRTPLEVPDTSQQARGSVVQDQVSTAAKQAGLWPSGPAPHVPDPSPLSYSVQQIPFQPGPTGLANLGPVCDDCVMNDVPIFPFTFYGNTYTSLQISSNGFVRFDPPNNDSGCCSGRPIPLNDLWNNIIAFAWTDLNPSGELGGRLRYETLGQAPARRWVLHADDVRYFGGTQTNLIQWLTLYETTNCIEIHTQLMTPRVITQGIENINGTEAHFVPGRVATTFSLENDGVRFCPTQQQPPIEVPIHDAFSGGPGPRQPPGIIDLCDDWVYIEIMNPLAHFPPGATLPPGPLYQHVRIGPVFPGIVQADFADWNPPFTTIRLRWSREALEDAELLAVGSTTLDVWGQDGSGNVYHGQIVVEVLPCGPTSCFWNNAAPYPTALGVGLTTHPNGGTGPIAGQHVSMSDPVNNTAGSNVLLQPDGPHFRLADDFIVPAGGCVINQVIVYAYQTGAAQPTWTSANLNVRTGSVTGPFALPPATTTTWQFTGIYRTFNGVLNNADRPIFRIIFDYPNTPLDAGTYWIDWQVSGGTTAWGPYITLPPVPPGGSNTQTVFGNGQQMFNASGQWQPTLAPPGAELPFLVRGPDSPPIPPPGSAPVSVRPGLMPADYSMWQNDRAR